MPRAPPQWRARRMQVNRYRQARLRLERCHSSLRVMSLKEKQIALLATLGVTIVVAIPALYLFLLMKSPVSFEEMDFDDNGIVTFSELIYANSYCDRVIPKNQVICEE